MMPGRRYSEGLHQALEAKEHVAIQPENVTLASITFQNYFRLYAKLAGMTGTALTEAEEFMDIYSLEVLDIPTNVPVARKDEDDEVYRTAKEKYEAIATTIREARERGQPVLVGTTSIEKSEVLSGLLKAQGFEHNVLNARYHEQEAAIIAQAGAPGAVTIATNMAGRGTDIVLGGSLEAELAAMPEGVSADDRERARAAWQERHARVLAAGGLHIIGTERHESRRIDNQLRGRSGRQGDPGSSKFYLSLEDDLLRIFGSDRVAKIMDLLKIEEGEAITHGMITKAIENAQKKVEAHNFEIRKHLIDYDDVMNKQREVIYTQRREILGGENIRQNFLEMMDEAVSDLVNAHAIEKVNSSEWDWEAITEGVFKLFDLQLDIPAEALGRFTPETLLKMLQEEGHKLFDAKLEVFGDEVMDHLIKVIMLQSIDQHWKEHLLHIDHLKEGIGLRGYGQKDPRHEYKKEAFNLFMAMILRIREDVVAKIFWIQLAKDEDVADLADEVEEMERNELTERKKLTLSFSGDPADKKPLKAAPKVGRNESCPCGSGRKYKQCCGK
ncbi:MAG TPA: SEC-C metal-binding domain-containing protein, partial [Desulfurivibrionaceae bacterium]|nr:SEC-C metal-binding domain-containing protein [Desulfurivibrionaceae bacterium]